MSDLPCSARGGTASGHLHAYQKWRLRSPCSAMVREIWAEICRCHWRGWASCSGVGLWGSCLSRLFVVWEFASCQRAWSAADGHADGGGCGAKPMRDVTKA